jgi:hypothetical protein
VAVGAGAGVLVAAELFTVKFAVVSVFEPELSVIEAVIEWLPLLSLRVS